MSMEQSGIRMSALLRRKYMDVLRMTGALALLLIGGMLTGIVPVALFAGSKEEHTKSHMACALLIGTGFWMLCFALLTVAVCFRDNSFLSVYGMYGVFVVLTCLICVLLILCVGRIRRFCVGQFHLMRTKEWLKTFLIVAFLYLCIAGTYFAHRPILSELFDLPERMSTMRQTNLLTGVNALTGELTDASLSGRELLRSILPAWYLFFARLFGIEVWDMLFKVASLWMLLLSMCAYYEIGSCLFGKNQKTVFFLVFWTLYVLCGNGNYMNPPHGLLHYAYEEITLVSNVLIPCAFLFVQRIGTNGKKHFARRGSTGAVMSQKE